MWGIEEISEQLQEWSCHLLRWQMVKRHFLREILGIQFWTSVFEISIRYSSGEIK